MAAIQISSFDAAVYKAELAFVIKKAELYEELLKFPTIEEVTLATVNGYHDARWPVLMALWTRDLARSTTEPSNVCCSCCCYPCCCEWHGYLNGCLPWFRGWGECPCCGKASALERRDGYLRVRTNPEMFLQSHAEIVRRREDEGSPFTMEELSKIRIRAAEALLSANTLTIKREAEALKEEFSPRTVPVLAHVPIGSVVALQPQHHHHHAR